MLHAADEILDYQNHIIGFRYDQNRRIDGGFVGPIGPLG